MNEDWVNDWYLLGATTDLAEGCVAPRTVGGLNLVVLRAGGEFFAARDACSDCALSLAGGVVRGNAVECPECGQQLAFSHNPADPAANNTRLSTFPVMVVDDEIFAWIEELA
jgi:nitrite reductase/ring-hydroxylating ferredoxin subunit